MRAQLRITKKEQLLWATDDLKQKYCDKAYRDIVEKGRKLARRRNYRRPWDGEDGAAFDEWQTLQDMRESGKSNSNAQDDDTGDDNPDQEEDEEAKDPYDWNDTQEMDRFDAEAYIRYLTEIRPSALEPPYVKFLKDVDDESDNEDGKEDEDEDDE